MLGAVGGGTNGSGCTGVGVPMLGAVGGGTDGSAAPVSGYQCWERWGGGVLMAVLHRCRGTNAGSSGGVLMAVLHWCRGATPGAVGVTVACRERHEQWCQRAGSGALSAPSHAHRHHRFLGCLSRVLLRSSSNKKGSESQ